MDYSYKVTTRGRAVMAACMALEAPFKITRVAFGAGKIDESTNPADVHELLAYVTDGAIAERRHEADRLFLTIQYANSAHLDVKQMFFLSEFMVFTEDPESGEETDLLYGTLGDYRQPIPAYNPAFPASVFNFPLVLVISDEVNVQVDAPAGLVTYDDLADITDKLATRYTGLTIPKTGWAEDGSGRYPHHLDVAVAEAAPLMIPFVTVMEQSEETALHCGLAPIAETVEGAVRFRAVTVPAADILIGLTLLRDSTGVVISGGSGDSGAIGKMPVATREVPGAVKPGPGLLISPDGTLSVDTPTDDEVREMLDKLDTKEESE